MRKLSSLIVAGLLVLAPGACDEAPTELGTNESSSSMQNSNSPFPVFHQGFNHDTEGWVDRDDPGGLGWCGTIERLDRGTGAVTPSAGRGYATVEDGACNDFWTGVFPEGFTSAPASLDPDLLSTTWPASGFVQQLDIYLDPDETAEGLTFIYANSVCVLAEDDTCPTSETDAGVFDFRYFAVVVTADGNAIDVAGHEVDEAGWYTFRHVFDSAEDGSLTVDFQLVKNGRTLATESIGSTLLSGESTSNFDVDDLGSGYIWFVSVADGLELPVDEHRLRRGS